MKSTATANPVLTAKAVKFMQNPAGLVGLTLFPLFLTGEQSAQYYVFDESNSYDFPINLQRAPGAGYSRSMMKLSDDSYACREYGHEEPVDDRERKKYASSLDADVAATRRATMILKMNHELRVKAKATSGSVPTSTPANKWDNYGTSDPVADVDTAKKSIWRKTGLNANVMSMPKDVFYYLKEHTKILDKIRYSQRGIVTEEILAAVFGVDRIIIADQLQNTAAEGAAATLANIWLDGVIIAHVDNSPDLSAPSFGRTFGWIGEVGADGVLVETYREDNKRSDVHRARQDTDEKLVVPNAGYYLSDTLTAI